MLAGELLQDQFALVPVEQEFAGEAVITSGVKALDNLGALLGLADDEGIAAQRVPVPFQAEANESA